MLDRIKGVSTMIDRCTLVNSQYNCVGFNFEVLFLFQISSSVVNISSVMNI